ncbi:hypothetical protein [Leekyejoonella antrihumi]|uniref:Uncharacterized protein n=1 Tax=Leekyejoonella antrihumi TaxID=1660198 RepID=A0A563E517_9MICO|nr:hypothetical protein [Leekyejoonella antrihumi]TWP37596.1 hypothetical protein FGL98_05105 [Leekyejoonella antrihumi]
MRRVQLGPPGWLILEVGQETDRSVGFVELAPQRVPVGRLIVLTEAFAPATMEPVLYAKPGRRR